MADIIVTCEHASSSVPPDLDLGVSSEDLHSHAAWDPGALIVARALEAALEAPLFAGQWTRLVADLNRSPDNAREVVPEVAFGVEVPGNRLSEEARRLRQATYHQPYWDAVESALRGGLSRDGEVVHYCVHSFVETYRGVFRELDLGLLVDPNHEGTMARASELLEELSGSGLTVRLNEPYHGLDDGIIPGMRRILGQPAGYLGVEIEINQRHLGRMDAVTEAVVKAVRRVELSESE